MPSNTSPSPDPAKSHPGIRQRGAIASGWRSWPLEIFFPLLLATLMISAITPLLYMFLGEHFGLTAGRPAPWPWGFAFVGLVGFWGTRLLQRITISNWMFSIISVVLWLLALVAWFSLQPRYDVSAVFANPVSLVQENAYFLAPIFVSMLAWWQGSRHAADLGSFAPEEMRGLVQRSALILTLSIIIAALIGGETGSAAIDAAKFAVPLCLLASVALVAGAEVESTRELAQRRGAHVPGWKRWYRLVGGFTVAIAVITLIVTVVLGPGAIRALLDGVIFGFRYLGWALGYVLYAFVYVLYIVIRAVAALLEAIFGDIFGPITPPKMENSPPMQQQQLLPQQGETGPWEYAVLLRWVAIGIALIVVGIIIFRVARRGSTTGGDGIVEEERESVFSANLAKKQLRDLFRRRHGPPEPERLDFERPPITVREAMIYLEVLAIREGVDRQEAETPADFASRLRGIWQGTAGALSDLVGGYQHVRYGEEEDPAHGPESAVTASAWAQIWNRRKTMAEDEGKDKDKHPR